jgi:hypothetical protein
MQLPATDGRPVQRRVPRRRADQRLTAVLACVPVVIVQLLLTVFVPPVLADMYHQAGVEPGPIVSMLFSLYSSGLGSGGVLALLVLALDALLIALLYFPTRRRPRWLLYLPVGVIVLSAVAYLALLFLAPSST